MRSVYLCQLLTSSWHTDSVALLKYDTQMGSTKAKVAAALYITAYNLLFHNDKICKN